MAETSQKFIGSKIVRGESPLNLEMPFEKLEGFITPTELFYVRTHFPIPNIDRDAWWVRIEGAVENPYAINYEQLLELKSVTIPVTLECAGNNRNFLQPKVKGVQWRLGAVGTAEWTGVPLSILLDRAGVKANACEVILEGADGGMLEDAEESAGQVALCKEHSFGESACGRCARLQNEWQRSAAGTRVSGARDCARLVRHGIDKMVATHHRHRPIVYRLLSND